MLFPTPDGYDRAAAYLRAGRLVAFPTETVYGLGGDARSDIAVARIFAAKGRPQFNPLIVHVADIAAAHTIATFDAQAEQIAAAFWPGPLTLVLPMRAEAGISPLVTSDLPTVALRVPAHPVAQALLRAFGGPIAAPSANISGRISPTRAAHVHDGLDGRIAAIIDGGDCQVGLESTIVGLVGGPAILRPGSVTAEAIAALPGVRLAEAAAGERPTAPGQLASHYAPSARVRLGAVRAEAGEVFIGLGAAADGAAFNLSRTGDLTEAAANLFHMLRQADALAGRDGIIAIAPVPERGIGRAINDRLRRAAAPRQTAQVSGPARDR